MAETLTLSVILNHLEWLRGQLGLEINRCNADSGALLAYNAAAMLQWRFVFPSSDQDRIADASDRRRAAKLIDDFVWKIRELQLETKAVGSFGLPPTITREPVLDRLTTILTRIVRQLPKLIGLPKPYPAREVGLEQELDAESLLRDWIRGRRGSGTTKSDVPKGLASQRSGLLTTMAAAVFTQQPQQGPAIERSATASVGIVAAFLELAVDAHVQGLPTPSAKRSTAFGNDLRSHLIPRSS